MNFHNANESTAQKFKDLYNKFLIKNNSVFKLKKLYIRSLISQYNLKISLVSIFVINQVYGKSKNLLENHLNHCR